MIFCAVVASSAVVPHVSKDTDVSCVYNRQYDSQLLPLPTTSPPRDDLFIDDSSDVEVNERWVVLW